MKIDFLINSLSGGGAERVMTTLANGFSKKLSANDISLITFNENEKYELNTKITRVKLHQGKIKNHTLRSIYNLFNFYKSKKNRPDIIISFLPKNNFIAIIIAKIFSLKVIVSEHSNHKVNVSKDIIWIRKLFYRYANATTVLTKFDKLFYEKMGAKITVMPNPIVLPNSITNFKKRNKNILVAGSLNRYKLKGFDVLLKLIGPILRKNKGWTLTIAGSGDKGLTELQKYVKDLNIENQVIFTGFCKDIESLMQNSQIFVLSSKYEGLPMVLMEALSNGMSCISYNCVSGPSDLINDGFNGVLIENQNSNKLSKGIEELINNDSLRIKLANNAQKSVEKYSLDNILNRWEILINSIINDEI